MTVKEFGLEVELRRALQRSLRSALDEVLALPRGRELTRCKRHDLIEAVTRCRNAIDAVRLYVSEYDELAWLVFFSVSSLEGAAHAAGLCDQLEREVDLVHDELVICAN